MWTFIDWSWKVRRQWEEMQAIAPWQTSMLPSHRIAHAVPGCLLDSLDRERMRAGGLVLQQRFNSKPWLVARKINKEGYSYEPFTCSA